MTKLRKSSQVTNSPTRIAATAAIAIPTGPKELASAMSPPPTVSTRPIIEAPAPPRSVVSPSPREVTTVASPPPPENNSARPGKSFVNPPLSTLPIAPIMSPPENASAIPGKTFSMRPLSPSFRIDNIPLTLSPVRRFLIRNDNPSLRTVSRLGFSNIFLMKSITELSML